MTDKRRYTSIISIAVFLIFAIAFVIYIMLPAEPRPDITQTWGYKPTPVYDGIVVSQKFVSQADGLSAIGVQFGLYKPISTGADFRLYEAASGTALKQIASQKVAADRISNGEQTVFTFRPLANSRGRSYVFTIKAPESDREHAVAVFLTGGEPYEKPYKSTVTLIDDKKTGRDMNFVTYCTRSNMDILSVFLSGSGRFVHAGGAVAFCLVMTGLFAAAGWLIGLLATAKINGDKD